MSSIRINKNRTFLGLILVIFISCSVYTGISGNETPLNTGGNFIAPSIPNQEPIHEQTLESLDLEENIEENIEEKTVACSDENNSENKNNYVLINLEELNNSGIVEIKNESEYKNNSNEDICSGSNSEEITEEPKNNTLDNQTMQVINSSQELKEAEPQKEENTSFQDKKVELKLFGKKGLVEIEGQIPENFSANIQKSEKIISEEEESYLKEITVWSQQHLESELTIYGEIPMTPESEKNQIKVYWVNEEKQVSVKEYLDINKDGYYDRISWIVPHLSEQIFQIMINLTNKDASPSELNLTVKAPTGEVTNPIQFEINASYNDLDNISCKIILGAESNTFRLIEQQAFTANLPNGPCFWTLFCWDTNFPENNQNLSGQFSVNESFSINLAKKVYLLGQSVIFNVTSKNKGSNVVVKNPSNNIIFETNTTTPSQVVSLSATNLTSLGTYRIKLTNNYFQTPLVIEDEFTVINLTILPNQSVAEINEKIRINVNINNQGKSIGLLMIEFGDSSNNFTDLSGTTQNNLDFYHSYSNKGSYILKAIVTIAGETFTIQRNGISINDSKDKDKDKPQLKLDAPANKAYITQEPIKFIYNVTDSSDITNCTFELYKIDKGTEVLDYNQVDKNLKNEDSIEIVLRDFDPAKYSWYVYCCDNESNCNGGLDYNREFTFMPKEENVTNNQTYSDHDKKEEIQAVLDKLDSFLGKIQGFDLNTKEALDDLGITGNLSHYRKKITQIDQDLGSSIKFIKDEALRENRKNELINEYKFIDSQIPLDFQVLDKNEFIKSSITNNLDEILRTYLRYNLKNPQERELKKISERIYENQKYITISTKVKKIKIRYEPYEKELTLVKKEITLTNSSFSRIIEVIPKDVAPSSNKIVFLTKSKTIDNSSIFEIDLDELDEDIILYYIEGNLNTDQIKNTETILYTDVEFEKLGLTGFSIFPLDNGFGILSIIILIVLILICIYLIYSFMLGYKISNWKKQENVSKIYANLRKARRAIKNNQITDARQSYNEIRKSFPLTPLGFRRYIYREVQRIQVAINKKDIFNLINEYETSKKEKRLQDANRIYQNIKEGYKKLPKQDRKFVYNKIFG